MSIKTKVVLIDLDKLEEQYKLFDFSILDKEHILSSNEFKKKCGYLKIETPKFLYINKFVCLRFKCYAYRSKIDGDGVKLKGICKGYRKIPSEQHQKCLKNETYNKECEQFFIRSHDHEKYLQQIFKKSLSPFDDKRKYINETISIPWGSV